MPGKQPGNGFLGYWGVASRRRQSLARSHLPGWRPRWTEPELVVELRRLHAADVPLTYRGLEESGHAELAQAINYCGGIQRLRQRWDLPRQPRRRGPQLP